MPIRISPQVNEGIAPKMGTIEVITNNKDLETIKVDTLIGSEEGRRIFTRDVPVVRSTGQKAIFNEGPVYKRL